ncbi:hypothetical protein [Streptomyces sp. ME19-01-6]|uniref:hypothetical protein n=1 Tax=Streptomyces sp. ME19-01-6 TaxID=3028686 RepID=UPI0029B9AEC8|nr:hypothetical protein [Streptomyces sp. ME19-01-6]MDX3230756.1 hypothetical protein [Streptomyces sp. ME19-01-6]
MHGPAPAPPPRPASTATVAVLRVVFVGLTMLTFGLLSWVTMLRVAILRRRALDWLLFWGTCVVVVLAFVEFGTGPDEPDALAYTTLTGMFLLSCAVTTHYLIVDIKHYRPAPAVVPGVAPYVPPGYPPVPGPGAYGYPGPPHQAGPPPQPVPPHQPVQPQPQPQPQLQAQPQPQRIQRVRAELDELSDYLRREQGR